jgi:hypothetical protein
MASRSSIADALLTVDLIGVEFLNDLEEENARLRKERRELIEADPLLLDLAEELFRLVELPPLELTEREVEDAIKDLEALLSTDVEKKLRENYARGTRIAANLDNPQFIETTILPLVLREMERFDVGEVRDLPVYVINILVTVIRRALER